MSQVLSWLSRLDTHTLLGEDITKEGVWTVVFGDARVDGLALLVALDVLNIHVEEVGGVHWAAFSFRVELRGEDGAGLVDHALVRAIVEVDEVLLEV